jgi:nucleotide-binding universal stress UspA family protein
LGSELPSDLATKEGVKTGDAALKIVEAAEEQKCDLIVIATHGHSAVRRLLLGSVTGKVVRLAPCPVLTIPGQQSPTGAS